MIEELAREEELEKVEREAEMEITANKKIDRDGT